MSQKPCKTNKQCEESASTEPLTCERIDKSLIGHECQKRGDATTLQNYFNVSDILRWDINYALESVDYYSQYHFFFLPLIRHCDLLVVEDRIRIDLAPTHKTSAPREDAY